MENLLIRRVDVTGDSAGVRESSEYVFSNSNWMLVLYLGTEPSDDPNDYSLAGKFASRKLAAGTAPK